MKIYGYFILGLAVWGCGNPNAEQTKASNLTEQSTVARNSSQKEIGIPNAAKQFIKENFSTAVMNSREKKSPKPTGTFYEVTLMDGTEIDFDVEGNWVEVDAADKGVLPISFLAAPIQDYLRTNFKDVGCKSVDKTEQGYELTLINSVDLYFDQSGNFIRQDK